MRDCCPMRLAVLAASNFTDPEHERLIWLAAGGLVLLGVLLTIGTVIWWRGTKGEHAALAPLEVMGDRSFTELTHVQQSRRLDAVRLHLDGDVEPAPAAADDAVDLDEALRAFQPGFDDLRDEPGESVPDEAVAAVTAPSSDEEEPPRLTVSLVAGSSSTDDEDEDEEVVAVEDEPAAPAAEPPEVQPSGDPESSSPSESGSVGSAHG